MTGTRPISSFTREKIKLQQGRHQCGFISSCDIYQWHFEDGLTSRGRQPKHAQDAAASTLRSASCGACKQTRAAGEEAAVCLAASESHTRVAARLALPFSIRESQDSRVRRISVSQNHNPESESASASESESELESESQTESGWPLLSSYDTNEFVALHLW